MSGIAYASAGLGGTLRMRGLAAQSGKLYQKANRIFHSLEDQFGLAYSYCGQGNAYRMREKWAPALKCMNRAIKIYTRLGQKGPLGFVLWSRAQIFLFKNKFRAALKELEKARKLFQSVHDKRGEVYVSLGLGQYYYQQQNVKYHRFFRRCSVLSKKLGLRFETLHAKRTYADPRILRQQYAACGVQPQSFFRYKTLP